jgi:predicted transcriptional regulator
MEMDELLFLTAEILMMVVEVEGKMAESKVLEVVLKMAVVEKVLEEDEQVE